METARLLDIGRWRALLGLLCSAGRGRVVCFGALLLSAGVLPTVAMVLTGTLVAALPAAAAGGVGSPAARPALLALGALVGAMVLLEACAKALSVQIGVLDADYALEVHHTVARVSLGAPTVARLEDPAFADELQAVQDEERRGVLQRTVAELAYVALQRLRGAGAFVVLLGFHWWAPLLMAAAWHLTNLAYLKEAAGTNTDGGGIAETRRGEYLRTLALEAPAAKEVRVFGAAGWIVGRYADAWSAALHVLWATRRSGGRLHLAAVAALVVAHAAVLGALAAAAASGEMGVAALLVFAQAVIAIADLGLVGDSQWNLSRSLALAERVARLRERAGDALLPRERSPRAAAKGKVALRLEEVRFTYPGRDTPTLDGLSLEVPAGQSLAIVGENGAGKSTLVKLVCGLYEPQGGRVTLDGAAPLGARGRVGAIFQDFVHYPLALRENVGFGRLDLLHDQPALEGALRDAGGGDLPARLPAGWDTVLSREFEGGADLSGGQWQRIALARALAAVRGGAGLLILDEPTAALDVRAETELFDRFLELTRDVTTILVSHRLSSVRRADRIVVIGDGRVVEDGTHDELMAAGGRYAEMFSLQAERFAAAPADAAAREEEVVDA
ncbi:MAG TPA: ABC transporter ATP-binding protein [Longimicrobium sp.]|jgi:ATP-binding cassette subfamily B protein